MLRRSNYWGRNEKERAVTPVRTLERICKRTMTLTEIIVPDLA